MSKRKRPHSQNKGRKRGGGRKNIHKPEGNGFGSGYEERPGGPIFTDVDYKEDRTGIVYCSHCNVELSDCHKFCTNCGKPIEERTEVNKSSGISPYEPFRKGITPHGGRDPANIVTICSTCGTELSENTRFCTACATPREKRGRAKKCRICGTQLSGNDKFCTLCGTTTDKKRKCTVCNAELFENIRFCTVCGTPSDKKERKCPVCSANISDSDTFCTACGNRVETDHDGLELEVESDSDRKKRFFAILEIEPSATRKEIKKAYKKKMIEYHPDKVHSLGKKLRKFAEEETKGINEAYRALMDEYA